MPASPLFQSKVIKATKLYLEDAETLFSFYSDAAAMKFRGNSPMNSMKHALKMIKTQILEDGKNRKERLAIRKVSGNELIGTLLLKWTGSEQCEIGFSFGKKHWGKGYGKETLRMIESHLESYTSLLEIKGWCVKENHASIRIFETAGYTKTPQNEYSGSILFVKTLKNQ